MGKRSYHTSAIDRISIPIALTALTEAKLSSRQLDEGLKVANDETESAIKVSRLANCELENCQIDDKSEDSYLNLENSMKV